MDLSKIWKVDLSVVQVMQQDEEETNSLSILVIRETIQFSLNKALL